MRWRESTPEERDKVPKLWTGVVVASAFLQLRKKGWVLDPGGYDRVVASGTATVNEAIAEATLVLPDLKAFVEAHPLPLVERSWRLTARRPTAVSFSRAAARAVAPRPKPLPTTPMLYPPDHVISRCTGESCERDGLFLTDGTMVRTCGDPCSFVMRKAGAGDRPFLADTDLLAEMNRLMMRKSRGFG